MARFFPSTLRGSAFAFAVAFAAGAQDNNAAEELQFSSDTLVLDGQTNMMRAQQPRITQGNLHIAADDALATGFEFDEAGEFRLTGNVRVDVDTASMQASSAVFTYANGQLSRGELEGTPVRFSEVDAATQRRVTGHAGKMSFDNVARTLRMTGDATVQLDSREVLGCDLIYDFRAALYHSIRILKPGGVLLINFPCRSGYPVNGIPLGSGQCAHVYWWFTPCLVEAVLGELGIDEHHRQLQSYGNYFALAAYMAGIPSEELTRQELETIDPDFPLLICARIQKPRDWSPRQRPGS